MKKIELSEQSNDEEILKDWDVSFKLHAPYQTTMEGVLIEGRVVYLKVIPESRRSDIEVMIK